MRLRDLERPSIFFLVFFLTLQTLYKYLPTLRTVLLCKYLTRGPHILGSQQFNHICRTLAEHLRESRASFSLMLAHPGALGRHVGPLGRHLVPLARHLIANMSENVPKSSKTAPKMPQAPHSSLPKVPKTKENLRFFNVFRFPTHLLKSSKNAPRTAPEAPKLSSKCSSCHYHAPSWHFHDPSWGHHVAILPLLFALLSPTCPKKFRKT